MPTVLRAHGLRFVIFTDDHPPPHVHVSGRGTIRIAINDDLTVLDSRGMTKVDIRRSRDAVREHRQLFLNTWVEIHGADH